jgi:predicted ABC-type ATPase
MLSIRKFRLIKGGPFMGPRGGLWADPQHKIPYRESLPKRTTAVKPKPGGKVYHSYQTGEIRHWVSGKEKGYGFTDEEHKDAIGNYKPERQALHKKIISSFVDKVRSVPASKKPTAIVMMGGPASGKGTVLKHIMGGKEDELVNVNPDDIKESLPEYQAMTGGLGKDSGSGKKISAKDAAFLVHKESSDVAGQVLASAVSNRQNLMLDGTGKDLGKFLPQIQKLKDAGYHVTLVMPHITSQDAQQRALNRAEQEGRYVPPEIIDQAHALIPGNFRKVAARTDEFVLFDNNRPPPRPVLSGAKGKSDVVHDANYMQQFFQYAKKKRDYASDQGWIKSWMGWELEKAEMNNKPPSITMGDILERVKVNRGRQPDNATGLDELWGEWESALKKSRAPHTLKKSEPDKTKRTGGRQLHDKIKFRGLNISIENRAGSLREWYDPDQKEHGSTLMSVPYGYVRGSIGQDGDHVDVFVGPNELAANVYIVNQMKRPEFIEFDEQKCMLGFDEPGEAKAAYMTHFDDARFFGTMQTMPFEEFKMKVLATNTRNRLVRSFRIQSLDKSSGGTQSFTAATAARIAQEIGIDLSKVDWTLQDLKQGMDVELEHSDVTGGNAIQTGKIVVAHLKERPDYYRRLAEMERKPLKKGGPYIGKRGGKWADPQHTIPWKESAPQQTSLFGGDEPAQKKHLVRRDKPKEAQQIDLFEQRSPKSGKPGLGEHPQDTWIRERDHALDAYAKLKAKVASGVLPALPNKPKEKDVKKLLRYLEAGLPGTGVEAHPVIGTRYGEKILLKLIQNKGQLK